MLKLTTESIKDFQICEKLYDYRYLEKIPETVYSRDIYTIKFENTIKNIINFFWFKKQAGITPSYASLLNRWEKIWFPKDATHYDIMTEQHESAYGNVSSLTSQAASLLLKFYDAYSAMDAIPLSISDQFVVSVNKTSKIEDKFDLIYRLDNINYVTKFIFNYKNNHRHMYQVDFTILYLAFRNLHPSKLNQTVFGYVDLLGNNHSFNEYKITEEDVEAINYWCATIESKDIFVPRRGLTSYCKKCPFDSPCSKWKFPNNIKKEC